MGSLSQHDPHRGHSRGARTEMIHEPGRAVCLVAQTIEHRYSGFIDFVESGRAAQRDRVKSGVDPAPLVQPRAVSLRPLRRMVGQEMDSIKLPWPAQPVRWGRVHRPIRYRKPANPYCPARRQVYTLRHGLFIQDFLFQCKVLCHCRETHPAATRHPSQEGTFSYPLLGGVAQRAGVGSFVHRTRIRRNR